MVLSMVAQILMTRKYVENWWLWILVNIISIGIYSAQGVYVLAVQYAVLCFLAIRGGLEWEDRADQKHEEPSNRPKRHDHAGRR